MVYVDQNLLAQLNTSSPALSLVQQIAVDNAGAVYVADQKNYRVVMLSVNSGAQLAVYATIGAGVAPVGVTVSSDNTLWVTDASSSRIVQLNGQGNITRVVPVVGNYVLAKAVAVDGVGRLYYIDDTDPMVVQVDIASGNIMRTLNTSQSYLNRPAALTVDSKPVCLAIDAYSNVFLSDTQNNAVYKMDATSADAVQLLVASNILQPPRLCGGQCWPSVHRPCAECRTCDLQPQSTFKWGCCARVRFGSFGFGFGYCQCLTHVGDSAGLMRIGICRVNM